MHSSTSLTAGERRAWRRALRLALTAVALVALAAAGMGAGAAELRREDLPRLFPGLGGDLTLGPVAGSPPAAEVHRAGELVGYVLSTAAVARSVGFAGRPLDVHVGLTTDARIAGARLAAHEEPILVIGVAPEALAAFVTGLAGLDIRQPIHPLAGRRTGAADHVAGATVSSAVIKEAVLRSARMVAAARGLLGPPKAQARVDRTTFTQASFAELLAEGAIGRRAFRRSELGLAGARGDPAADGVVLELYAALITPPTVGHSLLGRREYERLEATLVAEQHAVVIAANGLYSFKGTAWRQTGEFDRFQLVQGATTIRFSAADHLGLERLAGEGAPDLREIGVFRIPLAAGFDPGRPWRIEVSLPDEQGAQGRRPEPAVLVYRLPARFLAAAQVAEVAVTPSPPAEPAPAAVELLPELWEQIWQARQAEIAITSLLLVGLAVILFSHDLLVRNVSRFFAVRLAFLVTTVLFLGFYAGAQLSVVHVITFAHALLSGFHWEQFLLDPLAFILWSFVALALLFWGRGVFCGWLCPFGALQELLNQAARRLKIKQIEVPWALHERLWPIKYVAFLLILGVSLKSASQAFMLAEIEPFKTTITLKLMRAWPFVLFAVVVLATGLFIERFYCRYLCPLGAALALPARLRLFEWLKRRPQCGRECRICAVRCTVQAINPLGQIVPNECIYCLKCQANYYDAKTCLPLVQRAQRRQGASAGPAPAVARGSDNDDS